MRDRATLRHATYHAEYICRRWCSGTHRRRATVPTRFARSCLNRLQLRDARQMVDLDDPDPTGGLQFAGTLDNPIARTLRRPPAASTKRR